MVETNRIGATPEPEILDIQSVEDLAKIVADELYTPPAQACILQFLGHISELPMVDGVALAVFQARHLSIYAFTQLDHNDPKSRETVTSIGKNSSTLDELMGSSNPHLSCGLSFVSTRGGQMLTV